MSYDVGVSDLETPNDIAINCEVFNLEVGCLRSPYQKQARLRNIFKHRVYFVVIALGVEGRKRKREAER